MNPYAYRQGARRKTGRIARPGTGHGGGAQRPGMGTGTQRVRRRRGGGNVLFGGISIAAFIFFWMFLAIAGNVLVASATSQSTGGVAAAGMIGIFAFLFPLIGIVFGIIGLVSANGQKVVAGIGTGLNGLQILWILYAIVVRHG